MVVRPRASLFHSTVGAEESSKTSDDIAVCGGHCLRGFFAHSLRLICATLSWMCHAPSVALGISSQRRPAHYYGGKTCH